MRRRRRALALLPRLAKGDPAAVESPAPQDLATAIDKLEGYLTPPEGFQDVSRGTPVPHTLSDEKKREARITRDSWRLEVISDPEHPVGLRKPLTQEAGTAIDFPGADANRRVARRAFAKVMTCLNLGCPLGMGIWEGVPLRELVWLTKPNDALRRVFYRRLSQR